MADLSLNLDPDIVGAEAYRDLLIVNGDLVLTSDADERGTPFIQQHLTQRLRFLAGEWFMNNGLGIPYYQQLLAQRGRIAAFEALLQNTVLATPGVLSLLDWQTSFDRAHRVLQVTFRAQTATGVIAYSQNVNPEAGANA